MGVMRTWNGPKTLKASSLLIEHFTAIVQIMCQATHNTKVTLFKLSKECEQKSERNLSYHGYHKVEICAIKKQLWQVGVCEVICPNPTKIPPMRKSQNLEAER